MYNLGDELVKRFNWFTHTTKDEHWVRQIIREVVAELERLTKIEKKYNEICAFYEMEWPVEENDGEERTEPVPDVQPASQPG